MGVVTVYRGCSSFTSNTPATLAVHSRCRFREPTYFTIRRLESAPSRVFLFFERLQPQLIVVHLK